MTYKLNCRQEQMIAAAVQLDPYALWYHIKMRPAEAHGFASKIGADWSPELTPLLTNIDDAVPPMDYGPRNQNTGKPHHFYMVGREKSRVLYLCIMRSYMPHDFDYDKLERKLRTWARMMQADEAWCVDYPYTPHPQCWYCFRFWWD